MIKALNLDKEFTPKIINMESSIKIVFPTHVNTTTGEKVELLKDEKLRKSGLVKYIKKSESLDKEGKRKEYLKPLHAFKKIYVEI